MRLSNLKNCYSRIVVLPTVVSSIGYWISGLSMPPSVNFNADLIADLNCDSTANTIAGMQHSRWELQLPILFSHALHHLALNNFLTFQVCICQTLSFFWFWLLHVFSSQSTQLNFFSFNLAVPIRSWFSLTSLIWFDV